MFRWWGRRCSKSTGQHSKAAPALPPEAALPPLQERPPIGRLIRRRSIFDSESPAHRANRQRRRCPGKAAQQAERRRWLLWGCHFSRNSLVSVGSRCCGLRGECGRGGRWRGLEGLKLTGGLVGVFKTMSKGADRFRWTPQRKQHGLAWKQELLFEVGSAFTAIRAILILFWVFLLLLAGVDTPDRATEFFTRTPPLPVSSSRYPLLPSVLISRGTMPTAVPAPRQPQAAGPVEPPVPPPPLTVTLGKRSAEVSLPLDGTAAQLADALAEEFAVAPGTIKLLLPPPARGVVRLGEAGEQLLAEAGQAQWLLQVGYRLHLLASHSKAVHMAFLQLGIHRSLPSCHTLAGIHPGMHVKMMASPAAAVQAVAAAEAAGAAQRTAGFDHELRRNLRRAGLIDSSSSAAGSGPRQGEYGFLAFQAWQRPGLTPPPSEALRLLHR